MTRLRGAAALALAVGALGTPAAAAPQPIGRCTTTSGVVLAVDFGHWGGPVYRSCGTTPTTGHELLNQGGWHTTGTGHDGPAFICRIAYSGHDGGRPYPTPADDDCVLTPPASAYWSYWHADPGATDWSYSQLGAMLYKPKPGSVDLWTFGGTNIGGTEGRPKVTPDQLRAHNTSPEGQPSTPAPTPEAPVPPPAPDTGTPTPKAPSTAASSSAPPSPSPSVAPSSSTPSATPSPTTPSVVDATPAADTPRGDSGSLLPAAVGGALVALLAGAALFTARRRRRTG
ncbi:LPXTG cell wall anchor domain-containing protein [Streptomyces sp. 4F14]|uniref:LPXTG cell wall anchor domain-containing protein n=1 Tax=Streptomyces sp. 4F14 TaxID=3394380 RepID=UPI003A8BDE99